MRLVATIPFYPGDLGKAYNEFMELLGDDDWAILMDNDVLFTTDQWWYQLRHAIEERPHAGMFTCVTNRHGNAEQVYNCSKTRESRHPGIFCSDGNSHDMVEHRRIGRELLDKYGSEAVPLKSASRGTLMCVSKETWLHAGKFIESGKIGNVDMGFLHALRKAKRRIYMLPGLYVYHWYRSQFFTEKEAAEHWFERERSNRR
jgi:GT2 family glycosyltransferase